MERRKRQGTFICKHVQIKPKCFLAFLLGPALLFQIWVLLFFNYSMHFQKQLSVFIQGYEKGGWREITDPYQATQTKADVLQVEPKKQKSHGQEKFLTSQIFAELQAFLTSNRRCMHRKGFLNKYIRMYVHTHTHAHTEECIYVCIHTHVSIRFQQTSEMVCCICFCPSLACFVLNCFVVHFNTRNK